MPGLQSLPQAQPQQQFSGQPFPGQQPQGQQFPSHGFPGHTYQVQPPQQAAQFPPQFQPQAQGFPPQYQTQYQTQAQPAPQPQAAPVPPVAAPATPTHGAGQQGPQSQAQALNRQLIDLARTLEQLIPGYQIMQSLLLDLSTSPAAQTGAALDETVHGLKDALYYHGATLGAIRRLLCGETTPAVLSSLAVAFHALSQVQTRIRPLLERLTMAAPIANRASVSGLIQSVTSADPLLAQAGSAIQALIGPQIWEAARTRVQERLIERAAEARRQES
ncbi:MAG: hypothetical protein ACOY94_12330 [Bacillota bacterium]